jgi:hypothetical protein
MEFYIRLTNEFNNYAISNLCNVKNLTTNRILKPQIDRYGYVYVSLANKGFNKKKKVHRLMAEIFVENPQNKKEVNHKDGNPKNNLAENLEWVTHFENQTHKVRYWNCSSKYLGVTFNKKENKWKSQIQVNKKKYSLGAYNTEIEAYQARVNFEKEHNIANKYL